MVQDLQSKTNYPNPDQALNNVDPVFAHQHVYCQNQLCGTGSDPRKKYEDDIRIQIFGLWRIRIPDLKDVQYEGQKKCGSFFLSNMCFLLISIFIMVPFMYTFFFIFFTTSCNLTTSN